MAMFQCCQITFQKIQIQLTVFITISPPPSFLVLGVFLLCCLAASLAFLELSVNVEEKD